MPMMEEISYPEAQPIEGYGPGFFRIAGQALQGPLLVSPWSTIAWGGYDDTAPLLALADRIDVLFLGTGGDIAHAPRALRHALEQAGVGVEVMSSPAACRTYNLLLAEGRLIAVALIPV
ncbi:Mth938-like domain-containing protein [Falsirhodobacter sp. 20TX0035]|uniref:Mth938-like domain-containing protein n=1 Tax=Falsirhodobacter sp. 20TX0035 TaxID=3022019 RepID=UPI00232C18A1|nr:Mth938-like domain-containing protein [Falsirhodobacter sp. 20TX0035]MDB6453132.1 Mth938-like domain-containing protein [Falsirhodobacter sp. 20TX0035]